VVREVWSYDSLKLRPDVFAFEVVAPSRRFPFGDCRYNYFSIRTHVDIMLGSQ